MSWLERGRLIKLFATLLALVALATGSARATHSTAAPIIDQHGLVPNVLSTSSPGTSVRVHGTGFHARNLKVTIRGVAVSNLMVVDDNLMTFTAPVLSQGNADITVSTKNGSYTKPSNEAFWYGTTSVTASPDQNLVNGTMLNVTVSGMLANWDFFLVEGSPLASVLEPRRWSGYNPEVKSLGTFRADGSGSWSGTVNAISPLAASDPSATCPTTTAQADVGLRKCSIAATILGARVTTKAVGFTGDGSPGAASLNSPSTASVGRSYSIGGSRWNASPLFGSATNLSNRVGTQLTIKICRDSNGGDCSANSVGTGAVSLTRYISTYGGTLNPGTTAGLSGAVLSGSITPGEDVRGCSSCYLRVEQTADPASPGSTTIVAQNPISINS